MPEINNNENSGLIRNVRKLVDRVQPLVVSNKSMTRKGQSTQENISSNLNKLLKEQQMANRIQLKTMFAQKESPYAKLHENTETTNELLRDLIDKKGEKKKGLFSNVWDSLKTGLIAAAPMLASALGVALASAFTAKMFKDLGKNIADWIFEANKVELFQKRVTADAKRNMDERAEEMLEAGDLTKLAEKKVKQINQDIKTLIDQSRGTEKAGLGFLQKFNEIALKPFEYAGGKILGMFVDEGENIVSNIRREIFTDDFNKAKELGIYDRRLSEQENQARIDQYLMKVARERGTMFKTGDVVNKNFTTKKLKIDDNAFVNEVNRVANRLGVAPQVLMGIMDFETGGSFDPKQKSATSSATGLIQFMPDTAKELGTSIDELKKMSRTEQLKYVEDYFNLQMKRRGPLKTISDAYMAVLNPSMVGKSEGSTVFKRGTRAYRANSALDVDKDGIITKMEASSKVQRRIAKYEALQNNLANTPTGIVDRTISSLDQKFGEFMKVFTVENLEKAFGKAIVNGFRKPQSVNTNFVVGGRG